jgi:NAD(P)-dependent dehydrogenase (short-subunit alcohol dehydrogenase family)
VKQAGKVALITGAAQGIGQHIAQRFAHEGATVLIADVNNQAGEETAEGIRAEGGDASFHPVDVTSEQQVAHVFTRILQQHGKLDTLVNNAGATPNIRVQEMSKQQWQASLDLNLTSMFLCAQKAHPLLTKSPSAAIINITSLHAYATVPGLAAYAAAKAGVVAFTRSLALEFAPNIRVNAVAPGLIETETWRQSVRDVNQARQHRLAFHPLGRLGHPEDISAAVAFLASPDASFITGITLPVDGGLTAQLYREA